MKVGYEKHMETFDKLFYEAVDCLQGEFKDVIYVPEEIKPKEGQ